ncbi:MAG: sigma-70 family RNA polymerase sigma factor [Planctomycetaceae bacterium]
MTQPSDSNSDVELTADGELTVEMRDFVQLTARQLMNGFPLVRRWEETDDICQEAALRMHRALQSMEPQSRRHVENLVALQVRRTLIDHARKYLRTVDQCASRWTPNTTGSTGNRSFSAVIEDCESTEAMQKWTELHACVDQMPETNRETFQLMWYRGLQRGQVATLLGVDVSTVQRRWRSAREFLIGRLGSDFFSTAVE